LPIAILATLAVTTVLYIAVALTMTGLTNYCLLNSEAPLTLLNTLDSEANCAKAVEGFAQLLLPGGKIQTAMD
jgi:amino acid transporter